jgi:hypothetical protein
MTYKLWRRAAGIGAIAVLCSVPAAFAQTAPPLGGAQGFAVLGGSTVTNTGTSTISGSTGVSPGSAITGFPPGVVSPGTIHSGDATAALAQAGLTAAYNNAAAQPFQVDLTGQDLGGLNLVPAVYRFTASSQLTGVLTLDGQGDPNAVFIFQIGSTLTTASNSTVLLTNGAQSCNVFWQVGSSATLGTSSAFAGNVMALTSVTVNTSASVSGRLLARNGAVTLDTNSVGATCVTASCPVIAVAPAVFPDAILGTPYSQNLAGTGGIGPYTFSVTAGTLPAGMTLTAAGVLAGTPTTAGQSTFTIRATSADVVCFTDITRTVTVATAVPTLPQTLLILLALTLVGIGYLRLRGRSPA